MLSHLLCYAAVLKVTYYAQEQELCLVYCHCLYTNLHESISHYILIADL